MARHRKHQDQSNGTQNRRLPIRPIRAAGLGLVLLVVAACEGPYNDFRRETDDQPLSPVRSNPAMAAICHTLPEPPLSEVKPLADAHCARRGQRAEYRETVVFGCSLTHPYLSFFDCRGPLRTYEAPTSTPLPDDRPAPLPPSAPFGPIVEEDDSIFGSGFGSARPDPTALQTQSGWEDGIWGSGGLPSFPSAQ